MQSLETGGVADHVLGVAVEEQGEVFEVGLAEVTRGLVLDALREMEGVAGSMTMASFEP